MATRMQQRRGTAEQWTAANPILAAGEIGFETDTNKFKIGNGATAWTAMDYFTNNAALTALLVDGAPGTLNTLNELADAINNDPNFFSSISDQIADAIAGAEVDQAALAGAGIDWNAAESRFDIDSTVATTSHVSSAIQDHSQDTSSVHGIADTLSLVTLTGSQSLTNKTLEYPTITSPTGLVKNDVGLPEVDNTSDANKPLSNTAVAALELKANLSAPTFTGTVTLPSTTLIGDVNYSELSILNGATITTTELNYVDGVTSAIQTQMDAKAPIASPVFTGSVTLPADPSDSLHAATKQYVDNTASGVVAKPQVLAATSTNLVVTYANGTAGVGATLTATSNGAWPETVAGATGWSIGKGLLVKNQTNKAHNGRYYLSDLGSASTPWVLTRCGYCDEADEIPGAYIFVQAGTLAGTGWIQTVADPATFVVGTDDIDVFQFSGSGTITAGTGITVSGNEVSISTGAITSSLILDGTIVDGDINASAAIAQSKISGLTSDLAAKAPLADPTFTGTATIPTLTLTNPLSAANGGTGVSSLGTGVATFLGTPSSANLAAMITDEIGTGNIVLSEISTSSQTASYTLVAGDRGKLVEMNVGSANNLTVPLDSSVNFPTGTQIDILQVGSGQTTVVATVGVTINGTPGLKIRAQWGGATLIKRAANTWVLIGDLTA
jgi:hypothetical protein